MNDHALDFDFVFFVLQNEKSTIFFFDTWHKYTVYDLIHRGKEMKKINDFAYLVFLVCAEM